MLREEPFVSRRASLGVMIAFHRVRAKLSLVKAAASVGVNRRTWARWEKGEGSIPTELLPEISDAIDVDVDELLRSAA